MSFDDAIEALSEDALKFVKNGQIIGLGSGRAATSFVNALGRYIKKKNISIKAVPTSLQIKLVAEKNKIQLADPSQVKKIDVVFDGADQIDAKKNLIKGGGGALFRENILISCADQVVIMADSTKFVKYLCRPVPVEVHPFAQSIAKNLIERLGSSVQLRTIERGYPFVTENGNLIYDCDFGIIKSPDRLGQKLRQIAGVIEAGIFLRKPDVIYKANYGGKFEILD